MERQTSYTEVSRRFPTHVAEALADLRRGKSKLRNIAPEDMTWLFDWATRIRAHSFNDLISGKAQADQAAEEAKTAEESAKDEIKNTLVRLVCKAGHGRGYSKSKMKVPREIANEIRERHKKTKAEDEEAAARAAKQTPQEREAEIRKLLSQLGPGVIGIQVGPPPAPEPTLQSEVERMGKDLGINFNFQPHKELQGYVRGKRKLTYGDLKKAAAEKTPVWCRYKEHGEDGYRVDDANFVEISEDGKSAIFDNGTSFGSDTDLEGRNDADIVDDDGCGEGVFEVFEAVKPGGLDLKAVRDKIINGEKDFLKQMLANQPPGGAPQWAVDAVKKKLQSLEDGTLDVDVQPVKRHSVDDFLNADLDTLTANFQSHAKKKLKGRDGPPIGR